MIAILNADKNWGIGSAGDQPFYIPEDLKFFMTKTLGNVVIMGRATLEALPKKKPLPKRTNIVLTRQKGFEADGATICHDFDGLFEELRRHDKEQVFVIGGAEVYHALLPHCTKVYVTKIFAEAACDRHFPNLDEMPEWHITDASEIKNHLGLEYCFYTYERMSDIDGD